MWETYVNLHMEAPGPPWGHVYQLNNSESPTPKDVFWIRWNTYFVGTAIIVELVQ